MIKPVSFVFALFLITSCKIPYSPEISETDKLLVVDGLITDESNLVTVKLSNTQPFHNYSTNPEMGALVSVVDSEGNSFQLYQTAPGIYQFRNFPFKYGNVYTLRIKTIKNKFYRSSPQKLFQKPLKLSVNSFLKDGSIQTTRDGKLMIKNLSGLEFATFIKDSTKEAPYFRFSNNVMLEYTENVRDIENPQIEPEYFYCWKLCNINAYFNLEQANQNGIEERNHTLGFCPIDSTYFGIRDEVWNRFPSTFLYIRDMYLFVLTVKNYSLNKDVYEYYSQINRQLMADNKIFDPISYQVQGNITCENNPDETVLGVFEVSSTNICSYSFSPFVFNNNYTFKKINELDFANIDETGKKKEYPEFWVKN